MKQANNEDIRIIQLGYLLPILAIGAMAMGWILVIISKLFSMLFS